MNDTLDQVWFTAVSYATAAALAFSWGGLPW